MPFQLSPGVNVTEIDLTTIVPAVSSSRGAIAGIFNWGPVNERVLIDSEDKLVAIFGKPTSNNPETWFTAANFLSYTNSLYVVRAANTSSNTSNSALNAFANTGSVDPAAAVIQNELVFPTLTFSPNIITTARYPGAIGNSLKVSFCDSVNAYSSNVAMVANADTSAAISLAIGGNTITLTVTSVSGNGTAANSYANSVLNSLTAGDYILVGNSAIGTQYMQISTVGAYASGPSNTAVASISLYSPYRLGTAFTANSTINTSMARYWEFFNVVGAAPAQSSYVTNFGNTSAIDTMHIVVQDQDGIFTGSPGTILESYLNVSRATDAKTVGGAVNYYKTVINNGSKYIWAISDRSNAASANAINVVTSTNVKPQTFSFASGQDGFTESTATLGVISSGYNLFASSEDVDISLILQGKPIGGSTTSNGFTANNFQLANYLIDNISEIRKDCVVFITPDDSITTGNYGNEATAITSWRNVIRSSSYAVIDSGYKYQYDRYNDVYRYLPTNGDVAGLCARTDDTRDPWWSPAGLNRGQIKNVISMRFNPRKADRDLLYVNGINPVVSFPGQGIILFGDKTLLSQPSAFDRINVRRLFIVLEKAIATASKYTLFEFNDEFTRSQFRSLVTPYLRDVQARRGITDFLVVCDSTNNTPERIDRNEFWGDIYIKPARSINFIQLNFVAVRTGVAFSEVVGKF